MPAGIIALVCIMLLLMLWPIILMDVMLLALYRLGIDPLLGVLAILSIIIGSFINIPIKRYKISRKLELPPIILYGWYRWYPPQQLKQNEMVLAVNVGGCVVPLLLALYQLIRLINNNELIAPLVAIAINVIFCYRISELKAGVGILMPAFYPGIVAAISGLLLYPEHPAAVAFCAGIFGPLIGADLLRLKQIVRLGEGSAVIGGAGTFDGIVVSGFIALLLS
ncbi:DUF1614 domain-containing protein [Colwelliaceae bacterium 6471]